MEFRAVLAGVAALATLLFTGCATKWQDGRLSLEITPPEIAVKAIDALGLGNESSQADEE